MNFAVNNHRAGEPVRSDVCPANRGGGGVTLDVPKTPHGAAGSDPGRGRASPVWLTLLTIARRNLARKLEATFGAFLLLSVAAAAPAAAQQEAVCPDPRGNPDTGDRVLCEEGAASNKDIAIDLDDFEIVTTGRRHHGAAGIHSGNGDVRIKADGVNIETRTHYALGIRGELLGTGKLIIDVDGGSVDTKGYYAEGIYGRHKGDGLLDIDVALVDIDTAGPDSHGVYGEHQGTGHMTIDVDGGSITTTQGGFGIQGRRGGAGNLGIKAANVDIDMKSTNPLAGANAYGIFGFHSGSSGDLTIDVIGGAIDTTQEGNHAVIAFLQPDRANSGAGDLRINVRGGSFRTLGRGSDGLTAVHRGASGDVVVNVRDADIDTEGVVSVAPSLGIYAATYDSAAGKVVIDVAGGSVDTKGGGARGVYGANHVASGTGDTDMDVRSGAEVTTSGSNAFGIFGWNSGTRSSGDVDIDVLGGASTTVNGASVASGAASVTTSGSNAFGIYGLNSGTRSSGDVDINVSGGPSVTTTGAGAHGIFGLVYGTAGTGDIDVTVGNGSSVTTSGTGAHGFHAGTECGGTECGEISATVGAGASVRATGNGASGIRFGRFNSTTQALERAARVEDGYRLQTATARGSVHGGSGDAAGVQLAGGGRVVVRGFGSLSAASGIAIHAARKLDTDSAPDLRVDLYPGGRDIWSLLAGRIVNDGGRTFVTVHDEELFDSDAWPYASPKWVPNGARDVALDNRSTSFVTLSGDTMKMEFGLEESYIFRKPPDDKQPGTLPEPEPEPDPEPEPKPVPEPETEPDPEPEPKPVPEPETEPDPDPEPKPDDGVLTKYAPRSAVYEALPGFLLRLDGVASSAEQIRAPGSPVWVRLLGTSGSFEPAQASVGASHSFDGRETAAGLDVPLAEGLTAELGLRQVSGAADVSAPTGGGRIEAEGRGLAGRLAWQSPSGFHAAARLSATGYELDLSSSTRGALAHAAGARVLGWGAEAGRRFALADGTALGVRAWLDGSDVSMEDLTDAVGTRLSLAEGDRTAAGMGVSGSTSFAPDGRGLSLSGFMGLERRLSGGTAVTASGERLASRGPDTRLLLDLGAEWRMGGAVLAAGLSAAGPGSGDRSVSGGIRLSIRF